MVNREFKDWLVDEVNQNEWSELSQDGQDTLKKMMQDAYDYEKYSLSPKQVLFAIQYVFVTGFNAQRAAELAGYSHSYSRIASLWLRGKNRVPDLQEFISDLMLNAGASPKDVTGFLTFVMQSDFWGEALDIEEDGDGFTVKVNLKRVKELGLTALIKEIKWHMNGSIQSIVLHDGMKAAELLGQAHAMWKKSVEINNISQAAKEADLDDEDVATIKERIKNEALELKRQKAENRLATNNGATA